MWKGLTWHGWRRNNITFHWQTSSESPGSEPLLPSGRISLFRSLTCFLGRHIFVCGTCTTPVTEKSSYGEGKLGLEGQPDSCHCLHGSMTHRHVLRKDGCQMSKGERWHGEQMHMVMCTWSWALDYTYKPGTMVKFKISSLFFKQNIFFL